MIVYGDRVRTVRTRDGLHGLIETIRAVAGESNPVERHAGLVEALIAAGELAQGVGDAALAAAGHDDASDAERVLMALVHRLAALAGRSWDSGFASAPDAHGAGSSALVAAAEAVILPEEIAVRQAEGYAHYAVYPESYWTAAKALGPEPRALVLGIRSVGTSLSGMVAAALGAAVPLTARPMGHPFARQVCIGPRLDVLLRARPDALRAVVDEGPGLSGSSFAAAAEALEARAGGSRLVFFPGHGNDPGPQASPAIRARWGRTPRHAAGFDELVLHTGQPAHRLENWASDITGRPLGPVEDVAGGRWRGLRFGSEDRWPPCDAQNERRKYLLDAERGTFLLKFAGLGSYGRQTYARAKHLAGAGFSLEPLAFRHGFLVERWQPELRPLDPATLDRAAFLQSLGAYLAFRDRTLPAPASAGASAAALFDMVRHNLREALGAGTEIADRWSPHLPALERRIRRVETDNRLHAWEWLTTPDGRWIKTDAVDHCNAHDLVGCQDIAWDAAGASVEFDLGEDEEASLLAVLDLSTGRHTSRDLVRFSKMAYAAFQLGAFSMAQDRSEAGDARRCGRAIERYAAVLRRILRRLDRDGPRDWSH